MKLRGIYRGRIINLELPICKGQWIKFQEGQAAEYCFPQLNRDELEFIITSTPAEDNITPSDISNVRMVVDYRGLSKAYRIVTGDIDRSAE